MTKQEQSSQAQALRDETASYIREMRTIPVIALTPRESNNVIRSHTRQWLQTACRIRCLPVNVVAPIIEELQRRGAR